MANAPWYKRPAAEILSDPDVQMMTAEQIGWYFLMHDMMWVNGKQGYLTTDQHMLSVCCRCADVLYFNRNSKIVLDKFEKTKDGLFYFAPWMLELVEAVAKTSEKRRDAGKASAKKRAQSGRKSASTSVEHVLRDVDVDVDIKPPTPFDSSKTKPKSKTEVAPSVVPVRVFLEPPDNPWTQVKVALAKKINRHSYDTWVKPTRFSRVEANTIVVAVPTAEFFHIQTKYGDEIKSCVADLGLPFDNVTMEAVH